MRVTSAEFIKKYGSVTDAALSEPVTITRNGRPRLVLISADEYERLKRRDRRAFLAEEMSDEDLALLEQQTVSEEHTHLDEELKDWNP
jgi:prevent-host-death family protein